MSVVEHALRALLILVTVTAGGGIGLATILRSRGLMWTWALPGIPLSLFLWDVSPAWGFVIGFASLHASLLGARWHRSDIHHGVDYAAAARARVGLVATLSRLVSERLGRREGWITRAGLEVGRDTQRVAVRIPVGARSGKHTLVLGATGSGKTVTQTWIVSRLLEAGHGAIVIDPKGDRLLHGELKRAARRRGAPLLEWTPEGPSAYNPYAHGTSTEIADKALAGETVHRAALPAPGPALPRTRGPHDARRTGTGQPDHTDGAPRPAQSWRRPQESSPTRRPRPRRHTWTRSTTARQRELVGRARPPVDPRRVRDPPVA